MHIDQGVNFSKLATTTKKKKKNSKVGEMTFGASWLHSGPLCADEIVWKNNKFTVYKQC